MQPRDDYWWFYIDTLDQLYNLAINNYDKNIESYVYEQIVRVSDWIIGKSNVFDSGIVFGFKVIPKAQNGMLTGGYGGSGPPGGGSSSAYNYNIKCINPEYQSMPFDQPTLSRGSLFTNYYFDTPATVQPFNQGKLVDNGLLTSPSESIATFTLSPPSDIEEAMMFSTVYFKYRSGGSSGYYLELNHDFLMGADSSPTYILQHRKSKLTSSNFNPKQYLRNAYSPEVFPQAPEYAIDIGRIIWRIGTTESGSDPIYEYYLIDSREAYGFYGWRQIETVGMTSDIYAAFDNIDETLSDKVKKLWEILLNEMSWGSGGFIDYWTSYWTNYWNDYWLAHPAEEPATQAEKDTIIYNSISQTTRDLATELEE